jgi:two-component system, OmpR family, alkaline phosphatase synthesis response regulator PhoP
MAGAGAQMTAETRQVPRILVVDDEEHLADGIRENLEAEGYATEVAHDGLDGLEKIHRRQFDLILLDVMMPKMNGLEVCEEIRREGLQTPVLFLTVKGDAQDRILGLEAGGDDYLAKPFHLKELLLRVAAILKRSSWYSQADAALEFGGNRIDFETYHARSWDGVEHALTHKEAMILKVLSEQAGAIVTREEILDRVWGYEVFPSTRTIDNFIARLRKRFERNPEAPAHFHTVRGVGYRFTLQPEVFADADADLDKDAHTHPHTDADTHTAAHGGKRADGDADPANRD